MRDIFETIFEREELKKKPPILVDIGASGTLYPDWKPFAKYSVCIAFDPDKREMEHLRSGSPYKELYVENSVVTAGEKTESDFYLTRSPFCSSTLRPAIDPSWSIAPLFDVEKKTLLKARNLKQALEEKGIAHIDWFKIDSQGTDLKIFKSVGEEMMRRTLVADFEPGLIDAYEGEDKASEVLGFMEKEPFWMASMKVMGAEKMPRGAGALSPALESALRAGTATAPGWVELSYINDGKEKGFGVRDYLLLWVFATIKNQHGFAFEVASRGKKKFGDELFELLQSKTEKTAALREKHKRRVTKILRAVNRFKNLIKKTL